MRLPTVAIAAAFSGGIAVGLTDRKRLEVGCFVACGGGDAVGDAFRQV